ncbi:MAG: FAD-binding oxidoreductase [Rhodobacter sp.]|nr:FAD-binding oxidoreductase [Rhodobacter sp.]
MTDFLIIGGGIAGISAAARLSALGDVTVLEAEDALGYHASGRSAAMFVETYGKPSIIVLNRASKDYLMTANGGVLSPRGLLLLGGEETREVFLQDMKDMSLHGISVDEARGYVPILDPGAVTMAAHYADAWDIDTDLLLQNFARTARANGGKIITRARVEQIARTADGWQVTTSTGAHQGRILVNAAGAWVDQIAVLAGIAPLGVTPYRRSMARIPAPAGLDVTTWPMMFGPGESWYAKPDAGALLVSPADEDPCEPHDAWADDMVLAEGLARYEAAVTEPVTRLLGNWAGLRSFSPDHSLVIGPAPDDPTFFWLAGQGGYGMQTSPAASHLAADLIAGRAPEIDAATVAALSPERFT